MDPPATKPKRLSRVLKGLKKRLKGDSRTGPRPDEGIESANNSSAAAEEISEAEIVPQTREPVTNALEQPESRDYQPRQALSARIKLPFKTGSSVQSSEALPAPPGARLEGESFTSDGTRSQSRQKISDTPINEEDAYVREDAEDTTKQGADHQPSVALRGLRSNPDHGRPTETTVTPDKQLKRDGGRDTDGSSPGDATYTDSTGKTSYFSAPVKNTYTTPGYEWASKSTGYDWTSRKQHYGHDNPTMSEAYRRELGRRDQHLVHAQGNLQKMKEEAIGEESKEPGIKLGYMYYA